MSRIAARRAVRCVTVFGSKLGTGAQHGYKPAGRLYHSHSLSTEGLQPAAHGISYRSPPKALPFAQHISVMKSSLLYCSCLAATLLASPLFAEVHTLNLGGEWQLTQQGATSSLDAQVPGNVHLDLLRAGKIPDPFYRDNADHLGWIFKSTWNYEREFEVPSDWIDRKVVLLRCEGLDTVARIEINGEQVADTDNMYRTWEFDVKPYLRAGTNQLRISFSPIQPYIEAFQQRAPKVPNATGKEIANIRKSPYHNGWDFGQQFLTCGIYKPIYLVAYDTARISDVRIAQDLKDKDSAKLSVEVAADKIGSDELKLEAVVEFEGNEINHTSAAYSKDSATVSLEVPNPQIWWPNGMGQQPLYTVKVRLLDSNNNIVDESSRRIGLRDIQLLRPAGDLPLRLSVNGKEIYAKGANYIPNDVFPARTSSDTIRQRVADAALANMNMIRVWGGGYYPEDAFFDACDEYGVMVWSDFMFACAPYPGNNPEFQQNVRAEITDQIKRLRHHPSITVLCGNNEVTAIITTYKMISQEEYDRLFHEVIGTKVKELFPEANYVGGSPEEGDEHNWWVWHVGADFEHYRQSHGWMTEFGFQSFPEPATVYSYTQPSDRTSVLSKINLFHQKNGNGKGNEIILDKLHGYFREPKDFDSTLWLSQILQAYGMSVGIEHWRTDWPHSSGSLVWQLNDCWAGPSWSSIDYYGRWKAAQYAYRRVYNPLLIAGLFDSDHNTVQLSVASELANEQVASIHWKLTDLAGNELAAGDAQVTLPSGTSASKVPKLELKAPLESAGRNNVLLWVDIEAGDLTSNNVVFFARPKELDLQHPDLVSEIAEVEGGFRVTVSASKPALWTWLECSDPDARYSDNFFHLSPGQPHTVLVTPSQPMTLSDFQQTLNLRSLYDTYTVP